MTSHNRTLSNNSIERTLTVDTPPSQAFLILDTKSKSKFDPITNVNLTKAGNYFSMSKPYRYALNYVNFRWEVPNICPRNNRIRFRDAGLTEYNVEIPTTGYYNLEAFRVVLQDTLNNSGFATPFTVTLTPLTAGRRIRINNATAFGPMSSGQDRSPWEMAGIKFDPQGLAGLGNDFYGNPQLWYTRYCHVVSDTLNSYQYIPDECSSFPVSNILVTIFGNDESSSGEIIPESAWGEGGVITRPHKVLFSTDFPKWVSWAQPHANRALGGTIDLRLVDEYGKELYVVDPVQYPDYTLVFLTRTLE